MNTAAYTHCNDYGVVILVFISGLFQGLTLVSFPALGVLLKTSLGLTDTAYGFIFLPQVALTVMMGVVIGSYALGPLCALLPLSTIFQLAAAIPVVVFGMGIFSLFASRKPQEQHAPNVDPVHNLTDPVADIVICPACGGHNPKDVVFCGNPACHKALGEFKYVLEELMVDKNWFERLADLVTSFVIMPHFFTLHMIWFILWILVNSGFIGYFQLFDEYPFDLLSFILAIEAILVTGFLLISQNSQTAYSEKRAELDYEINIRSYRKLTELERRLDRLTYTDPGGDSR